MPARERFAWVWITTLVVVFSLYFAAIGLHWPENNPSFLMQIAVLTLTTGTMAMVVGADRVIAWARGQGFRFDPPDERDRCIEWRASAYGYYVLMAGMIVVGCMMPFTNAGWDIVHAALFFIVIAELVHHGAIVLGYRRGWHA